MFEKETVEVTCPKCGHKSQENVGRLKSDGYTCPECATILDAKQLARALKEAEGGVEKLKGEIAKLKKQLLVSSPPRLVWFSVKSREPIASPLPHIHTKDLGGRGLDMPLSKSPITSAMIVRFGTRAFCSSIAGPVKG